MAMPLDMAEDSSQMAQFLKEFISKASDRDAVSYSTKMAWREKELGTTTGSKARLRCRTSQKQRPDHDY